MKRRHRAVHADRGLTLIELVIVTTLLGLVATVISAVFVTVLRTAPPAQFRIDDARSTRGLQSWLARDIASTPPNSTIVVGEGGYIFSGVEPSGPGNCGITTGINVVHMTWVENGGTGESFYANYRLVPKGADNKIVRYICSTSAPSPSSVSLTSGVSAMPCASLPLSRDSIAGGDVESVDLCVVALQSDTGLSKGGDSKEITITVSSRNYVDTL